MRFVSAGAPSETCEAAFARILFCCRTAQYRTSTTACCRRHKVDRRIAADVINTGDQSLAVKTRSAASKQSTRPKISQQSHSSPVAEESCFALRKISFGGSRQPVIVGLTPRHICPAKMVTSSTNRNSRCLLRREKRRNVVSNQPVMPMTLSSIDLWARTHDAAP